MNSTQLSGLIKDNKRGKANSKDYYEYDTIRALANRELLADIEVVKNNQINSAVNPNHPARTA
jgi:hypothetical protein